MSTIALSNKGAKLMKLCDLEGFNSLGDLLQAVTDSVCPAICMTEGCDCTTEMEPDQTEGYCLQLTNSFTMIMRIVEST